MSVFASSYNGTIKRDKGVIDIEVGHMPYTI